MVRQAGHALLVDKVRQAKADLAAMQDLMEAQGGCRGLVIVHWSRVPLLVAAGCTDPRTTGEAGLVSLVLPADL